MAQYAIIKNGACENIVECDAANADASWVLLTDSNSASVAVGSSYDSGTGSFTLPASSYTAEELKEMSKKALVDSDWTQLADVGLTADSVLNWRSYRATLRDIKDGDKGFDEWPEEPAKEYV